MRNMMLMIKRYQMDENAKRLSQSTTNLNLLDENVNANE
jgi:hypothetical protein